ncbi:uncharacterized protein LOC111086910 isoform X2 [Limulus polyphemus]|uniref:Uncharacterized protein LOC111086910 isoform X2 n=1 Tax=Limulus polyphemus TaxID=6850 RepID=A0ABM1SUU7_LIMPO|nr:uncharacterized protein LOC111086910 isoform X2 [Limulus polyphemus]
MALTAQSAIPSSEPRPLEFLQSGKIGGGKRACVSSSTDSTSQKGISGKLLEKKGVKKILYANPNLVHVKSEYINRPTQEWIDEKRVDLIKSFSVHIEFTRKKRNFLITRQGRTFLHNSFINYFINFFTFNLFAFNTFLSL